MKKSLFGLVIASILSANIYAATLTDATVTSIKITASNVTFITFNGNTTVAMGWTQDPEWIKKMIAVLLTAKSTAAKVDIRYNAGLLLDINMK